MTIRASDAGTASAWAFRITETGSRWSNSRPRQRTFGVRAERRSTSPTAAVATAAIVGTSSSDLKGRSGSGPTVKPEPPPGGVAVVTCEVGPILGDQPGAEQRGDRRRPGSDPPEQRSGDRPRDRKHAQVPFVNAKPEEKDARPETMSLEPQHR